MNIKTVLSFRCSPRTIADLEVLSTKCGSTRSETIRIALASYLRRLEGPETFWKDIELTKKEDILEEENLMRRPPGDMFE